MKALRMFGRQIVHLWETLQVELHGKYSVERLYNLQMYSQSTNMWKALLVLTLTPVPCLLAVVVADLIPLESPERGLAHSHTFWVRVFLTTWMMNFTVLEQCRFLIPELPMRPTQNLFVSLFSSSGATGIAIALAWWIGYPLPFLIAVGSPGCCALLAIAVIAVWGKYFRHNQELRANLWKYMLVVVAQLTLTYVYPAYNFAFVRMTPSSQTAFALLLPIMKIAAKNGLSYLFRHLEDFKPEMVIFNVEIFHALFVAYCMQNSTSMNTTIVLMASDFFQACLSLRDVNLILREIHDMIRRTQVHIPSSSSEPQRQDTESTAKDWCTLDLVLHIVRSDKSLQGPNSTIRFESHSRSQIGHEAAVASETLVQSLQQNSHKAEQVPSVTRNSIVPSSDLPQRLIKSKGGLSNRQRRHHKSSFANIFRSLEFRKTATERDMKILHFVNAMSESDKLLVVQKMLQLLHLTEYLLLIEFTEVIIPVVYCIYTITVFKLPNRIFYDQLRDTDSSRLKYNLGNVMVYAFLEVVSFICLSVVLRRKLHISPTRQLAFVLATQWEFVQSKLILWVVFSVQTSLMHFGVDYSFQFAWLKTRTANP